MNMLLQGMQTQGIHQTLQSQPNSAQPGFLLLPNLGLPHQARKLLKFLLFIVR